MSILKSLGYADAKTAKSLNVRPAELILQDIFGKPARATAHTRIAPYGKRPTRAEWLALGRLQTPRLLDARYGPATHNNARLRPILFGIRYGVVRSSVCDAFMAACGYSLTAKPRQWGNPETFHSQPATVTIHVQYDHKPVESLLRIAVARATQRALLAHVALPITCNCTNPTCPVLRHWRPEPAR